MSDERWIAVYYHNRRRQEVVLEEIQSFGLRNYAKILGTVELICEYGLQVRGHLTKHIEGKLWEIRVDKYRVLYCAITNKRLVMLKAFVKKTDKTPAREIKTAWNRLQDYLEQSEE